MTIRVEPFIQGFLKSMKPHLDQVDRDLLGLIFSRATISPFASVEEKNPNKPAYYFRFGCAHLNVLFPTWLLNGKTATQTDRFRIAVTHDYSFILDTKESILYDPSTEILHALIECKPLWLSADWKEESAWLYRDELLQKRLKVFRFSERLEQIPLVYTDFCNWVAKHRLRKSVPAVRFGLDLANARDQALADAAKENELRDLILSELWSREEVRSPEKKRA